ncbi:LMBR1 domain-containing protein 2-like A, partial [Mucuna pruriens]
MWVFYMFSLPVAVAMVIFTLKYFSGPHVPRYVFFTVAYTWFCSLSIIILVPADIWTTLNNDKSGAISFLWSLSYWSTFLLTWAVVPTIQGYEDAGDFTVRERLKTSLHGNLVFYLSGNVTGFAMACSNTFGLVTGAFLLGFGLSEIPKGIWLSANWTIQQRVLSHKVSKMAVKLDDAHHDFSNAIVITQATSKQMSKRDSLRPYMNIIDKMLLQMVKSFSMQLKEDPSFKPQGGRLGESDMDYDTDEKSMAALRRRLTRAREQYYRYRSEYTKFILEALELEDTIKNYEHRDATGWKYISCLRPERKGKVGAVLDTIEFLWRCILWKYLEKSLAVMLGCMSFAILLAEATILTSGVDLSLFSILVHAGGTQEVLVQKMGKMNDAVPFFGKGFNKIYPLIMVIYTSLVASNIFNRVIEYCGNWKIFKFKDDAEDMDGFDPSGVIILQKERSLLQQGHNVGELVFPLARSFNINIDVELTNKATALDKSDKTNTVEVKNENDMSRKIGNRKYTALRTTLNEEVSSSLTSDDKDSQNTSSVSSSGIASKWESMMHGFQSLRTNLDSKKFLPLANAQGSTVNASSSFESLDEIFERLKHPPSEHRDNGD